MTDAPEQADTWPWVPYGPPLPATNPKSTRALVLGILSGPAMILCGTFFIGLAVPILAIVFGVQARREIRTTGQQGAGAALVGLVLGVVILAASALTFVVYFGLAVS